MISYSPHPGQIQILRDAHKYVTVVCGRRFGKTYTGQMKALKVAMDFPAWIAHRGYPTYRINRRSPAVVGIIMPTLRMARQLYWKPLKDILHGHPAVADINSSQMVIRFHGNRPDLAVLGANDVGGDRLRGLKFVYVVIDEFQDVRPGVLDTVLTPASADTPGSQFLILGTPKGRLNHYYEISQRSREFPNDYSYYHFCTEDNPHVPSQEIDRARLILPPRLFRQEYEASFEDYEGKIFAELDERNLYAALPPIELAVMGVDWGETNPAVVVWGRSADSWYWLEGWQGDGRLPVPQPVFESYIIRLATKYNIGGCYCDPSRPSSIIGLRALGMNAQQRGLQKAVAGNNRIEEGINFLHSLMYQQKLFFPRRAVGIPTEPYKVFEAYRRETNRDGIVTEKVAPNQDDHIIDGSRYALVTFK